MIENKTNNKTIKIIILLVIAVILAIILCILHILDTLKENKLISDIMPSDYNEVLENAENYTIDGMLKKHDGKGIYIALNSNTLRFALEGGNYRIAIAHISVNKET